MKKLFFIFTTLIFNMTANGGVILWNTVSFEKLTGYWAYLGEHILIIDDGTEHGYVDFLTKVTISENQAALNDFREWGGGYNCTLLLLYDTRPYINYDLFLNADNLFSQSIANWPFPGDPPYRSNLIIPKTNDDAMNTIMLAFALSRWNETGDYIDYYGWFEMGYNGEEVYIVNSAMSEAKYGGIYAGVIPEPSTALLALSGCALFFLRRRKICITSTWE